MDVVRALSAFGGPAAAIISFQPKGDTKKRVPVPSHRHASPSAPWPWVDLDDEVDQEQLNNPTRPIPTRCPHNSSCDNCWRGYPQSRFPNWTFLQVIKSKLHAALTEYNTDEPCILYRVDVNSKGFFSDVDPIVAEHGKEEEVWQTLIHSQRPQNLRVRGVFIENLSGPILQMLGTKYNIEPLFWSSSLNWIPSRFQTDIQPQIGDSITITLTFLKSTSDTRVITGHISDTSLAQSDEISLQEIGLQEIDTRAPLVLYSSGRPRSLVQDLLSIHLVRHVNGSTIFSYHPTLKLPTTTASFFHTRIRFAGQSVYWQTIFQHSPDPTFILLTFIWHALYAWDEAVENLYDHICFLETRVMVTTDIRLTHELHVIRAHQLHYTSLLEDYAQHMNFVMELSNPVLDNPMFTEQDRKYSRDTMRTECGNMLLEIERLKNVLQMQKKRLINVMDLVFSSVNISDNKYLGELTAVNVKDSIATRQIAYLIMVFLPASFATTFFGMNVEELTPNTRGTLIKYFAIALPLTVLTAWIVTSFQYEAVLPEGRRLAWPVYLILKEIKKRKAGGEVGVDIPISVVGYQEDDDEGRDHRGQEHVNGM